MRRREHSSEPWFLRSRLTALLVAGALFAGIFGLRLLLGPSSADAVTLLFVMPVALLAFTFGFRGGVTAALVAVALVALWVLMQDVELSVLGWVSRILPLALLGTLLGQAADRIQRAELVRRRLALAQQRQREAAQINDTLVQGMSAAKWAIEADRVDSGLQTLNHTLELGHRLVSDLLRDTDRETEEGSADPGSHDAP